MEWDATRLVDPETGEELFGSGIQHGLLFRDAAQTIPSNGKVALMNLSWDAVNTVYTGRGVCPILIQVMNINCSNPLYIGLVGYMPVIQLDKDIAGVTAAKNHIIQTCIGHILDQLEAHALYGFKCTIGDHEMLLFPRLGAMTLDTILSCEHLEIPAKLVRWIVSVRSHARVLYWILFVVVGKFGNLSSQIQVRFRGEINQVMLTI